MENWEMQNLKDIKTHIEKAMKLLGEFKKAELEEVLSDIQKYASEPLGINKNIEDHKAYVHLERAADLLLEIKGLESTEKKVRDVYNAVMWEKQSFNF